jgi:Tol biopolymer transport system component
MTVDPEAKHRVRTAVLALIVFATSAAVAYVLFRNFREAKEAPRLAPIEKPLPVPEYDFAYVSDKDGDLDLYLTTLDGDIELKLTDDQLPDTAPEWSPDGTRIAYTLSTDTNTPADVNLDIWVTAVSQEQTRPVTSDPRDEVLGGWSPDSRMLVFETDPSTIEVVNMDGTDRRRLGQGFQPAWSPDGAKIAYARDAPGDETDQVDIWVMDETGGSQEQLTDMPGSEQFPAWSPDGKSLAFDANDESGIPQIFILDMESRIVRALTNGPLPKSDPSWSPDGRRILYEVNPESSTYGNTDLYVINVDGTNPRSVVSSLSQDVSPAWNPVATSSK